MRITVDGALFSRAIEHLKEYAPEGHLFITSDDRGPIMFFREIDTAGVAFVEAKLRCQVEGDIIPHVGIQYIDIPTDFTDAIVINISDRMLIEYGRLTHKFALLSIPTLRKVPNPVEPDPRMPELAIKYAFVFDVDAADFANTIDQICKKIPKSDLSSDGVRFEWTGTSLIVQDKGRCKLDAEYDISELAIRTPAPEPMQTMMSIDYARGLLKTCKRFQRVVVGFSNWAPISVGGSTDTGFGCGVVIAPRMDTT